VGLGESVRALKGNDKAATVMARIHRRKAVGAVRQGHRVAARVKRFNQEGVDPKEPQGRSAARH